MTARLRRFAHRLVTLFRSGRAERELDRELSSHLNLLEDEFQRQGMTRDDAARAALRATGGVDQAKERHRDARSFRWLEDLRRDLRYAVRTLAKSPGYAAVALATLALGIGMNTAVFSIVEALLLRDLPVASPHELVRYRALANQGAASDFGLAATYTPDFPLSGPLFDALRTHQSVCTELFAWADSEGLMLRAESESRLLRASWASGSAFRVLGVHAYRGRLLGPEDDRPGGGTDGPVGVTAPP